MEFKNESELQDFIHSFIGGKREVSFDDGSRIDILTSKYAVEVKPKLTRASLLQALGQSTIYKEHCPDKVHVVAGLTPKDAEESYANAERVRATGTQVWYIDQMPQFIEHWEGLHDEQPGFEYPPKDLFSDKPGFELDPFHIVFAVFCFFILAASFGGNRQTVQVSNNQIPVFSEPKAGALLKDNISRETPIYLDTSCSGNFIAVQYGGDKFGWVRDVSVNRKCSQGR